MAITSSDAQCLHKLANQYGTIKLRGPHSLCLIIGGMKSCFRPILMNWLEQEHMPDQEYLFNLEGTMSALRDFDQICRNIARDER